MIFKNLHRRLLRWPPYLALLKTLDRIILPGFKGISLWEMLNFLIQGIRKTSLTNRAAAVSFKFFMAIFPGLIFLLSILPYLPSNFTDGLLLSLEEVMPGQIFSLFESTIEDLLKNRQTGLLSLGFLLAAFFSTNGMVGLMKAFNESAFITETRKAFKQRLIAIALTFLGVLFLLITITVITLSRNVIVYMYDEGLIGLGTQNFLLFFKWVVVYMLFFFMIATIFYFAPARNMRWNFFSPGATVSTLFSLVFTIGISIYIRNFNNYNQVYGVLGTFPVILIWIFLNALALLIGFELNISLRSAYHHYKKEKRLR